MGKNIKFQIRDRWTDSVIFEYEKEDNTKRDTVIQAIREGVDLSNANLVGACLHCVDFSNVDMHGADLYGADLRGCLFFNACLIGVSLRKANLDTTRFDGAELLRADLTNAILCDTQLDKAKNVPYYPLACPSEGAFIGWKKVRNGILEYLIKLEIPEDARRCSAGSRKCRCDKARVLGITRLDAPKKTIRSVVNCDYNPMVIYEVGEMVYPDSYDENRWNECSHGIHFFINKHDAIHY